MRLLDQVNDLELLGGRVSHSSSPPSPIMLFQKAKLHGLLGVNLLEVPRFPAQMIKIMENNIETPLNCDELAGQLNCSRQTMERAARLVLNESPMWVYLKVRLQVARNLLFYDQTPIGEIALICGFSSVS